MTRATAVVPSAPWQHVRYSSPAKCRRLVTDRTLTSPIFSSSKALFQLNDQTRLIRDENPRLGAAQMNRSATSRVRVALNAVLLFAGAAVAVAATGAAGTRGDRATRSLRMDHRVRRPTSPARPDPRRHRPTGSTTLARIRATKRSTTTPARPATSTGTVRATWC